MNYNDVRNSASDECRMLIDTLRANGYSVHIYYVTLEPTEFPWRGTIVPRYGQAVFAEGAFFEETFWKAYEQIAFKNACVL